jgi:hypothetical protein
MLKTPSVALASPRIVYRVAQPGAAESARVSTIDRLRSACGSRACSRLACACFAAAALTVGVAPAFAQEEPPTPGSTESIVKPLHRFDVHLDYQRLKGNADQWTTTLRYERPYDLGNRWKLAFRADLPLPVNNENPLGEFHGGVGDLLLQATLSQKFQGDNGYGFAMRMIAPTASSEEFGGGRWRMLPTVGVQFGLPGISNGSFFQPLMRYQFDVGGDSSRRHYSDVQLAPTVNIALENDWYVTLFPSTDIRYNFIQREWFVPFNVEVGRQWSRNIVTSLELGVPIYREENPVYLFKLEGRLTVLF